MQVGDGHNPKYVGFDLEDDTEWESVYETTPRVFRHRRPRFGVLRNASNCRIDFFGELKTKARLAVLVVPHGLV